MRRARSGRRLISVGVVAALAFSMAACGGGDDTADDTVAPVPPATPAPTTTDETAPPATEPAPAPTTVPAPETTEADVADGALPGPLELVWTVEIDDIRASARVVAMDPNGDLVVIGSAVGYVHHLADGELVDVIRHPWGGPDALAFSPDGSMVAAGFNPGRVVLTTPAGDIPAGMEDLLQIDDYDGANLGDMKFDITVAFAPDGERLVTSSRDGLVEVWDLADLDVVSSFEAPDADDRRSGGGLLTSVLEVRPGGELVGAVDFDCHLNVWNIDTGAVVHSFPLDRINCYMNRTFQFSPDGALMAAAFTDPDGDHVVRLWSVDDAAVVADLPVGERNFSDLSFSPDSTMLVTSSFSPANWLTPAVIWDVATATVLHEVGDPDDETDRVVVARFTPDGGHVLVGYGDGAVELWRLPGAEVLVPPEREACDPVPIPGDVLFDTASATLRPDADAVLEGLAEQLAQSFPDATLTFVGHTDSRGSDDANRQLSLERAASVHDWFAAWAGNAGIDGWVLEIDGIGADQPRVSDLDADGNFLPEAGAVNRRVEIGIDAPGCEP